MIPKTLHRILLPPQRDEGVIADYWTAFAALHPGWELRTWHSWREITESEFGERYEAIRTPAGIADLMRLEILWRHGGFYVDTDMEPMASFEPLRWRRLVVGTEDGVHVSIGVIGAPQGSALIRRVLDLALEERRELLAVPPNLATGPGLWTVALAGQQVDVLPPECFYPESWSAAQRSERASAEALMRPQRYAVHRWAGTWTSAPEELPDRAGLRWLRNKRAVGRAQLRRLAKASGLPQVVDLASAATAVGDDRVVVKLPSGWPLLAIASDLSLTPSLVTSGVYDRAFWNFLGLYLEPGDHVVDVGANIGLFTVRMAELVGPQGRVDAFEPDPYVHQFLSDNVEMNWISDRVRLHQVALSGATGELGVLSDSRFRGSTQVGSTDSVASRVVSRRLDEVLTSDIPIALVKIDVEGHESQVLDGLAGLLRERSVRALDLEIVRHDPEQWRRLRTSVSQLEQMAVGGLWTLSDDGFADRTSWDVVQAAAGHLPHLLFLFSPPSSAWPTA